MTGTDNRRANEPKEDRWRVAKVAPAAVVCEMLDERTGRALSKDGGQNVSPRAESRLTRIEAKSLEALVRSP